jgi:hypothetical protein
MPSKFTCTESVSTMSAAMGCVVGSWSCRYAHVFHALANVVHEPRKRVASAWARIEA